jgi:type II secretory pathway component GspD/PulD (secretin)
MNIPGLGALFSTNSTDTFRTELIITVSPRVIEEELRSRMANANELEESARSSSGGP